MKFWNFIRCLRAVWVSLLLFLAGTALYAHPTPDIPVWARFQTGGDCVIQVEVTPRFFDPDPERAAPLAKSIFETFSAEQKRALCVKAADFVSRNVEFFFEPLGQVKPEFAFEFTGEGQKPLTTGEDTVVMTGSWKSVVPAGLTGWKVRAVAGREWAVVCQNVVDGTVHPRLAVLFPGETSHVLDLSELRGRESGGAPSGAVSLQGGVMDRLSTFWSFLGKGFVHVLPLGTDHILFVLGIFLLSRNWRPVLWQVTAFTVAHSVTLGLAACGVVKVASSVVEPVIAASIVAVAVENILRPRYTHWRLLIVFGFGLVHGLGFAGVLSDLNLPVASFATGLIGFNLGVEAAQLAVIAIAAVSTLLVRDPASYRRLVVVPVSLVIAGIGLFWTIQRVMGAAE